MDFIYCVFGDFEQSTNKYFSWWRKGDEHKLEQNIMKVELKFHGCH